MASNAELSVDSGVKGPTARDDLRRRAMGCAEDARRWLKTSGIRQQDGAYRSIYDPRAKTYSCWYGNETCLNATTGAVLALSAAGEIELALQSARHICELSIHSPGSRHHGAIRAGRGSRLVFTNWIMSAVMALLRAHEVSREERYRSVAIAGGLFVADRMQHADGSIRQAASSGPVLERLKDRFFRPRQIWLANAVEAFRSLAVSTGDKRFERSAARFVEWLRARQRSDGAFPAFQHTAASGVAAALWARDARGLRGDCHQAHPTAISRAIRALAAGHADAARRAVIWAANHLSPNGLFYEQYDLNGGHSVSEDVMPTAFLGLTLLDHPRLIGSTDLLDRITAGLVHARIESDDPDAHGAFQGLPLHSRFSGDAYCWDTAFATQFLIRFASLPQ